MVQIYICHTNTTGNTEDSGQKLLAWRTRERRVEPCSLLHRAPLSHRGVAWLLTQPSLTAAPLTMMPALKRNLKVNKLVLCKNLKHSVLYWNNKDQIQAFNPV
ncbi:hypothetical protein Ahy_B02g057678 [Arachis hypogaea]|uniref:Uncharacterized protein n=1 Tax=Arachis hypogaea TaxID=3818 RepID=A0A445ACZ7_ARAHY|nr:hypothetical protein Ahy_B02g057678 [Arachis hypogaea]